MRIYLPVAVVCAAIALIGFWPTYFGPLLAGTVQAPPIIHVHAAVFSGWLLLVIVQVVLAATGRKALHMRIGKAPFLAAAWIYRRSPEVHKRLIVVATTILLIAAVHRTTIFGGPPPPLLPLLLVWLAPIGLGIAADLSKRQAVHPVYIFGVAAVLFLKFGRRPLAQTEAWKELINCVTSSYA